MVEEHNPQFNDVGELQKVDFLEGDVHLGFYDIRFNLDDNKFFNITNDGVVKVRVHTEPGIEKLWILFEDPNFRPIELSKYARTKDLIIGEYTSMLSKMILNLVLLQKLKVI